MRRLFAAGPFEVDRLAAFDDGTAKHLRVLRLGPGAEVELFDGEGGLARARLEPSGARVTALLPSPKRPDVTLVQALAKGDKLDVVVRMATEIGVRAIEVVETEHVVPGSGRVDRWRRIAREAARQSEQAWAPVVGGPSPLLAVAARAPASARRLVLAARGASGPPPRGAGETWLVIGPEGGLTTAEEDALVALGFVRWTLPTGVLRTETAAAVALGALL